MSEKMGKAGRHYELTEKGHKAYEFFHFAMKLQELADEKGCTVKELYSRLSKGERKQ